MIEEINDEDHIAEDEANRVVEDNQPEEQQEADHELMTEEYQCANMYADELNMEEMCNLFPFHHVYGNLIMQRIGRGSLQKRMLIWVPLRLLSMKLEKPAEETLKMT